MITATLDTGCINVKKHPSLDIIHKLHQDLKIMLYKTDTVDTEISYGNPNKKNKQRLEKSKLIPEDKGAITVGHSRVGHALVGSDKKLMRLFKSSKIKEDIGFGYFDNSRFGHMKFGDEDKSFVDEFKVLLFKDFNTMNNKNKRNAFRDCMHLSTHLIYGRGYFITLDKTILKAKEILKEKYGINVINPNDFVQLKEIKIFI